jgi:hypothetical protein
MEQCSWVRLVVLGRGVKYVGFVGAASMTLLVQQA